MPPPSSPDVAMAVSAGDGVVASAAVGAGVAVGVAAVVGVGVGVAVWGAAVAAGGGGAGGAGGSVGNRPSGVSGGRGVAGCATAVPLNEKRATGTRQSAASSSRKDRMGGRTQPLSVPGRALIGSD